MKKTKEREVLQDEAALTAIDTSIVEVQNQLDAVVAKRQAIEVSIASKPGGVAQLNQYWKMKNLDTSEQFLTKKLERLKYRKSLLEPQRNIPGREQDEFDEFAAAEKEMQALEEEKLAKIRESRMNKENDKEMER